MKSTRLALLGGMVVLAGALAMGLARPAVADQVLPALVGNLDRITGRYLARVPEVALPSGEGFSTAAHQNLKCGLVF